MGVKVITALTAKQIAITDVSFDESYLDKYIEAVQIKYLKPAMGKDLYNDYLANIGSLPANYQTLKDEFIDKALSFYVVYEAFPEIRNKLTNQGIMHNGTEFSEQTPSHDYGQLRSTYNYNGNIWIGEMIEYLIDNSTDYPLFERSCDDDSSLNGNNKGFIFY